MLLLGGSKLQEGGVYRGKRPTGVPGKDVAHQGFFLSLLPAVQGAVSATLLAFLPFLYFFFLPLSLSFPFSLLDAGDQPQGLTHAKHVFPH